MFPGHRAIEGRILNGDRNAFGAHWVPDHVLLRGSSGEFVEDPDLMPDIADDRFW